MNVKQRHIKNEVEISGGRSSYRENCIDDDTSQLRKITGLSSDRVDLRGQPEILVDADNVTDTSRGTTITQNGASVSTIEHLMASLMWFTNR